MRVDGQTVRKRINISLESKLHAWAQKRATQQGSNLSAMLTRLLERERNETAETVTVARKDLDALRQEIAEDVLKRLAKPPSAGERG